MMIIHNNTDGPRDTDQRSMDYMELSRAELENERRKDDLFKIACPLCGRPIIDDPNGEYSCEECGWSGRDAAKGKRQRRAAHGE